MSRIVQILLQRTFRQTHCIQFTGFNVNTVYKDTTCNKKYIIT